MFTIDRTSFKQVLNIAFRTITPWNRRYGSEPQVGRYDYTDGWNDCVKEIRKNRKKYFESLEKDGLL